MIEWEKEEKGYQDQTPKGCRQGHEFCGHEFCEESSLKTTETGKLMGTGWVRREWSSSSLESQPEKFTCEATRKMGGLCSVKAGKKLWKQCFKIRSPLPIVIMRDIRVHVTSLLCQRGDQALMVRSASTQGPCLSKAPLHLTSFRLHSMMIR